MPSMKCNPTMEAKLKKSADNPMKFFRNRNNPYSLFERTITLPAREYNNLVKILTFVDDNYQLILDSITAEIENTLLDASDVLQAIYKK